MGLSNTKGQRSYVNISSQEVDGVKRPAFRTGKKGSYQYFNNLEGIFKGISFFDGEFENEKGIMVKTRNFEMVLKERNGDTEYYVTGSLNGLTRDMFNKLSSVNTLGLVNINLYLNKSGFFTSRCMNNGDDLNWKLTWEEQDKLITKTVVDDKVVKGFKQLNQLIEDNMKMVEEETITNAIGEIEDEAKEPVSTQDDDLPF